jgi:flagellum-specific peptidoglycan hydrolase FlgJ
MSAKTENFINLIKEDATIQGAKNNIPPSIIMAQAILESGWGESGLSVNANNYFGIKANSTWKGEIYNGATHEYYDGLLTYQDDDFRAYKSAKGSFKDHSNFLKTNQRYSELFKLKNTDYVGWAKGLKSSGYATSPTYAEKLIALIEQHKLYTFDKKANFYRILVPVIGVILITFIIIFAIKKFNKKTKK